MSEKQLSLFASLSKSLSKKITSRKKRGNDAEQQACKHLQSHGLKLIQKNFSTQAGEVDLIMQDDETIVFIEVRYRKNADFGGAAASVTPKKQQRIIKAALAYQQKHNPQSSMRFDVVAIEGDNRELDWIQNAFSGF
jgi:putative endonuclease